MARRRSLVAAQQVDISPVKQGYLDVWGKNDPPGFHPFGPDSAYPDFRSWCDARAALVDKLDTFGLTTEDFNALARGQSR